MTVEMLAAELESVEQRVAFLKEQIKHVKQAEAPETRRAFYGMFAGQLDYSDEEIRAAEHRPKLDWLKDDHQRTGEMIHVADTHSLLWFLGKNSRLSLPAREALEDATVPLVVPAIILREIAFLHSRRRVALDLQTVLAAVWALPNSTVYPSDDAVA